MRKKIFIFSMIGLAFAFILTYSCNDSLTGLNESIEKRSELNGCNYNLIAPADSFNFEFIGQKHNELLLPIMEDLHRSNDYSINRIMYNFRKLGFTFDSTYLLNSYETYITDCYNKVISNLNSEKAKTYYNNIYILMDSSNNLIDYKNKLDINFSNALNEGLCTADLKIIEGSTSIAKYSAFFWAPKSWGGQGNYDKYAKQDMRARWKWGNAALGDISGCGAGMIVGAFAIGFFGGPVGGAFAFGIIGSAVAGSTFGGAGIPG